MSRATSRLMAPVALAIVMGGCGGGGTPTPGPSVRVNATPTAPAGPTASAAGRPGAGLATVSIGGVLTTITGGSCGHAVLPPEFGGGNAFGINIGTPNFTAGGPDYLGVLIETPGPDPDGVYEMSWGEATGTLVAGGQDVSLAKIRLEVRNDGTAGVLTSTTKVGGAPVIIEFTC